MNEVTLLLQRLQNGDSIAADELAPLVYSQLRRIAAAKMARDRAGQTMQPTSLVHEAWIRLGGGDFQIGAFSAGGVRLTLTPGPQNDLRGVPVGASGDVTVREVE